MASLSHIRPSVDFKQAAYELLPEGASFDASLTCGLCSSGCPASGLENMDPRKFIRLAMLGMNDVLAGYPMGLDLHPMQALYACLPDKYRHRPAGVPGARRLAG